MQPLSIYLILVLIFQFSGCAKTTSTASVAPITDVGALPAQKTQSELRVGADPYYANRQTSIFGQDLSQKGLLPVMVYLQNNGAQPLKVVPNTISLELQDVVIATALPNALLPAPHRPYPEAETTGQKVGRGVAMSSLIALLFVTTGYLAIGEAVAVNRDQNQKKKLQKECQKKGLSEVTLAKGESAQGFVYFYIPQGIQQTIGAQGALLIVPYLPSQGRGGEVRVPLAGM